MESNVNKNRRARYAKKKENKKKKKKQTVGFQLNGLFRFVFDNSIFFGDRHSGDIFL
eukprot:m.152317 g.152317  ORF g.152317 m.152317 type:complete len:57 (-) comp30801_c3_seq3:89-259(-)